ncbi:MAG: hypothetical protein E7445_02935 [Ruminococcaceae bacterium]|nr:hypothetical protein [Oscillospiraceae bacterium]
MLVVGLLGVLGVLLVGLSPPQATRLRTQSQGHQSFHVSSSLFLLNQRLYCVDSVFLSVRGEICYFASLSDCLVTSYRIFPKKNIIFLLMTSSGKTDESGISIPFVFIVRTA